MPSEPQLVDFSVKTGETYRFTRDPVLVGEANQVEAAAWLNTGLGDCSENRQFDDQSRVFVALREGSVVAVARLFQGGEYQLPAISKMEYESESERERLIDLATAGELEEFGILARDVKHSVKRETALHLFRLAYRDAKARGIAAWVIIMEPSRVRMMNRWYRFTFKALGPAAWYQGGMCAPHVMVFEEVEQNMARKWSRRVRWFRLEPLNPPHKTDGIDDVDAAP